MPNMSPSRSGESGSPPTQTGSSTASPLDAEELVPDEVIPHHLLPPLRYRDLPEAPPWTRLVGPGLVLAGLALGSGEFVLWPSIVYKSGFVFIWACLLGVVTQFFLNMEIERWTLATGESAITGFCRLSRQWAWVMLVLNFVPWVWPGWATGASTILSWAAFGPVETPIEQKEKLTPPSLALRDAIQRSGLEARLKLNDAGTELKWSGPMSSDDFAAVSAVAAQVRTDSPNESDAVARLAAKASKSPGVKYSARYAPLLTVITLLLVGVLLTSSPVVYTMVERVQTSLVVSVFVVAAVLGVMFIQPHALWACAKGIVSIGSMPAASANLDFIALLGALAFAGAGGTMNLGQSHYIRDKGYAMGRYVGRITSPLTGNEEPIADTGFHFKHTPENMRRWREWWRAANIEHGVSFLCTCVVCLLLLTLLSYSLFYQPDGTLKPGMERFGDDLAFVWGEATLIGSSFSRPWMGMVFQTAFLLMGAALLFTTELGVLDATSRIAADIIKINFLRGVERWPLSRLYFVLLWMAILTSAAIVIIGAFEPRFTQPLLLLKLSAAMNGAVMFLYSMILLYMNSKILSRRLSISPLRFVVLIWSAGFFGFFTIQAWQWEVWPEVRLIAGW